MKQPKYDRFGEVAASDRFVWLATILVSLASCATMGTHRLADNLSQAIRNQDDPATVRDGAPAFLLLVDGLLEDSPDDTTLLVAAARLYGAYSIVFVQEPGRAQRLAEKARTYARRALCRRHPQICLVEEAPYAEFLPALASLDAKDLPVLYAYAAAWADWIHLRSGDWVALADIPKVEAMMERVVELGETFDHGQAHLYLGVMRSQLPTLLGGQPEAGRDHFERAIELSDGRNLMAKVEYAEHYARLLHDRDLHDRLLQEVLDADPAQPDLTLSNTLAQGRARQLLDTSAAYFGD